MAGLQLDDAEQPIDHKLVMAIESAFRKVSLTTVEFVAVPRAWQDANRTGSARGPKGPSKENLRLRLARRDGAQCGYCGRGFVDLDDATLDHIVPNSVVGHWQQWNLMLSCSACNNLKADRVPLVVMPLLCTLLHELAKVTRHKTALRQAQTHAAFGQGKSKKARRRARARAAYRAENIRRAVESMSGVPFRLAIEAPKTVPALMPGGAR